MTSPNLRRIKLLIEYDGAPFAGWQRQARHASVQEELERALASVVCHPVTLHGAGRTDSGVHALGMAAHFDTSSAIPAGRIPRALAALLPEAISVLAAESAAPDFDARRDALLRWYRYQIDLSAERRPLGPRAWRVHGKLDAEKMKAAVGRLQGNHDFSGFRSAKCTAERTRLDMDDASMMVQEGHGIPSPALQADVGLQSRPTNSSRAKGFPGEGGLIIFDFKCRSFLQRQVRLMVGALVGVGQGRLAPKDFNRILSSGERPDTVKSAPPQGLCLMRIAYAEAEKENILTDRPPGPSF